MTVVSMGDQRRQGFAFVRPYLPQGLVLSLVMGLGFLWDGMRESD
jgi:hypothetical protein